MAQDNIDDIYPLSPMQSLMLTHTLNVTGSHALANQFCYEITGHLDEARFQDSWRRIVQRHAVLRTAFVWEGLEDPVQVVRTEVNLPFETKNLSSLDPAEREINLQKTINQDRARQYDVRIAPLMAITLIRLEEFRWVMLWNRHHLILDGWCVDLLFDELFSMYSDPRSSLRKPGSFREYIQWIANQDYRTSVAWWQTALQDSEVTLIFPRQRRRPASLIDGLPTVSRAIENSLQQALTMLAREAQTTLATVIQAALAILLSAATGHRRVVYGLTVVGRPAFVKGIEATMGCFINSIPVPFDVNPDNTLTRLFSEIQQTTMARQAHEYLALPDIHAAGRLPGHLPTFDLLALLHSPASEIRNGPGFTIKQLEGPLDSAYPFVISLAETKGILQIEGSYDSGIVEKTSAHQLVESLLEVLRKIAASPNATLKELAPSPDNLTRLQGAIEDRRPVTNVIRPATPENTVGAATILCDIWQQTLGLDHVGLDDDFFAIGGTSIQAALVFAEIERRLGPVLPLSVLFRAASIRELLLELEQPQPRTSSLIAIQPGGDKPPLVAVPGLGGNVVGLGELARACGPVQPFFGLQSKGLDGIDTPLKTIEAIASEFIGDLPNFDREHWVLLGVCWGATVAFEIAQQLGSDGPALLLLLDPVVATSDSGATTPTMTKVKIRFAVDRLRLYVSDLRSRNPRERMALLREKTSLLLSAIRKRSLFQGVTTSLNQDLVSASNLSALRAYQPKRYHGRACLMVTRDRSIPSDEVDPRGAFRDLLDPHSPLIEVRGADTGDTMSGDNVLFFANQLDELISVLEDGRRSD